MATLTKIQCVSEASLTGVTGGHSAVDYDHGSWVVTVTELATYGIIFRKLPIADAGEVYTDYHATEVWQAERRDGGKVLIGEMAVEENPERGVYLLKHKLTGRYELTDEKWKEQGWGGCVFGITMDPQLPTVFSPETKWKLFFTDEGDGKFGDDRVGDDGMLLFAGANRRVASAEIDVIGAAGCCGTKFFRAGLGCSIL
jgi:hypothetical protein